MPSILQRFTAYVQSKIPVKRVTVYNDRYSPRLVPQTMDVDRVHSIVEGAIDGDTRDLFALYRDIVLTDSHLQNEFGKRKLAVLGDKLSIQPADKKAAEDVKAQETIQAMIKGCCTWKIGSVRLLDSTLLPVALVEKVFRPSTVAGLRYELDELVPVPDQLLDYTLGRLRIRETDPENGQILGGFIEPVPERYIIHRGHLLTSEDNRGGPMRSLVFWWLLKSMSRDWWARFLDKYGSPFLVGKYDQADDASRGVLERAFQWSIRLGGLVVSKQTEVEVIQAATSQSGDAYEKFLAICGREQSKLILGQTLSSDSQPLGIGGGASEQQEDVRQDIRQWDAACLGETWQSQLFRQFLDINGLAGETPSAVYGGESAKAAKDKGELLASLHQAGLELTDDGIETLSEQLGLPLQRQAVTPAMPPVLPMSARALRLFSAAPAEVIDADLANDSIARRGAADLAQAFRGSLAPVRRMIAESTSAEDLQTRLLASYPDWPVSRVAEIFSAALEAYAANGAAR